jgi:glycosyltransferase involved in cell wall biosynthesis
VTPLSAVLIARDEEANLAAALESVAFCDERVVVDGGSLDRTRDIAAAAGARVIVNAPWPGFVAQRDFATRAAAHDWVLVIDADERVTPELRVEILALRAAGFDAAGYRIPRLTRYLGRWVRHTDWYPDLQLRLFDRRRGGWQGERVHESVRVDGPVQRLRAHLEHHPYLDVSDHVLTIDRYTTLWAEQAHAAGRQAPLGAAEGAAFWALVRNAILRGGILDGRVGLTVSVLNAFYAYLKLAKLRELYGQRGA